MLHVFQKYPAASDAESFIESGAGPGREHAVHDGGRCDAAQSRARGIGTQRGGHSAGARVQLGGEG